MDLRWLLFFILAVALGAFFVVYGEYDDSPGGQLLGLMAVILGIAGLIKSRLSRAISLHQVWRALQRKAKGR